MTKRVSLFLVGWSVFVLFTGSAQSQQPFNSIPLYINNGVYLNDPRIAEVARLWQDYLNSRPDSLYDNPYWSSVEKKRYHAFDIVQTLRFSPSLYSLASSYRPTLLSVSEEGDHWRIRTLFSDIDSGYAVPLAIFDVMARREKDSLRLWNAVSFNTNVWQHHTLGSVTFICPPNYQYDKVKATRLTRFLDSLTMLWHVPQRPVDYYYADREDEVDQALGLIYGMGFGNAARPSGHADQLNDIVVSGGLGEFFPHEFVHIYLNRLYPNANSYISEGYAAYLGGSRGLSVTELCRAANDYLKRHPALDLDSLLASDQNSLDISYDVGTVYVFGGLFCKLTEARGGFAAMKKLFTYPPTSAGLFQLIDEQFGVRKGEVNAWLRKEVAVEAGHK